MKKILIVDDDSEIRAELSEALANVGYYVDEAASGKAALEKIVLSKYDIILLDLVMPGLSGIEVLDGIRKVSSKVKVIMITAFSTVGSAIESMKKGANDYISKPFKIEELLNILGRAIEETKFEEDVIKLDYDNVLISIANPMRRKILKMLKKNEKLQFMEILKELDMEKEHQKVVYHLRVLRQSGIIEQDKDKSYIVAKQGENVLKSLEMFEKYLNA
ncbi:MAG: response regulator [Nitrospirae bacterium]|nr:response regulator [Nitrospirota bacterium]